jgi:Bacteriocin-protection, YdeI or OmpD-Associated/Domain of unknown function (DUF1905)
MVGLQADRMADMATDQSAGVSFDAILEKSATGNATGIVVPPSVIEQLASGKKPPVQVTLNTYTYRTTIGVMNGNAMIPVSSEVRKAAGLSAGDKVSVTLLVDATPRSVKAPTDFAKALAAEPAAKAFFAALSNSLQRFHIDNINAAKTDETRQKRVAKSVQLFLDGKQR